MKTIIIHLLMLLAMNYSAQKIKGIYLSDNDFKNNKLTFEKKENNIYHIKLHHYFYKPYIIVKHKDTSKTYSKDSLYGYKDVDGNTYRFFGKSIYTILNPREDILLYSIETKTGETKYQKKITTYYFSENHESPILRLTMGNLLTCFSNNKPFIEYITLYFKTKSDLSEYDFTNHQYKLNSLLKLSTQH